MLRSVLSAALPLAAAAPAFGAVIGTTDFEGPKYQYSYAYPGAAGVSASGSYVSSFDGSDNALRVDYDTTGLDTANTSFAGFAGGFGIFGPATPPINSKSDLEISFDVQHEGLVAFSDPLNAKVQLTFKVPDVLADGDDFGGNDFADDIARLELGFVPILAQNGVTESVVINLGAATEIIQAGGTPEKDLISFTEFLSGKLGSAANAGASYSDIAELQVAIEIQSGLVYGSDNDNALLIDNVTLTAIPEPTSLAAAGAGLMLLARRRRR